MKMEKICCVLLLFLCISLNAADKNKEAFDLLVAEANEMFRSLRTPSNKILDVGAHAGILAMLPSVTRIKILSHRLDVQDGINETLQRYNMQLVDSIEKLTETVMKLTKGLEQQQTINDQNSQKFTAFNLCMGKLFKENQKLKQHFEIQIESMVHTAQEQSKPILTLNDIRESSEEKDLITLCESLETSCCSLKEELKKKNDVIRKLSAMILRQDDDIDVLKDETIGLRHMILKIYKQLPSLKPGVDTDSEYESPSGCFSPRSSVVSCGGSPRSEDLSSVASQLLLHKVPSTRSLPVSPRGLSPVRRAIIATASESAQSAPVTARLHEQDSSSDDDVDYSDHSSSDDSGTGFDEKPQYHHSPQFYRAEFSAGNFFVEQLIEPDSNTVSEQKTEIEAAVPFLKFEGRTKGRHSFRRKKADKKPFSALTTDN